MTNDEYAAERQQLKRQIRERIKEAIRLSKTDYAIGLTPGCPREPDDDYRYKTYLRARVPTWVKRPGRIEFDVPSFVPGAGERSFWLWSERDLTVVRRLADLIWVPEWTGGPLEQLARTAE